MVWKEFENIMNILCKIFGHKLKNQSGSGIDPTIMKYVVRNVIYCTRCEYIKRKNIETRDFDMKEGLSLDSRGCCGMCILQTTCVTHKKIPSGSVTLHCPIKSFMPTKEFSDILFRWKETILE